MNKRAVRRKNQVLGEWADKLRELMIEARDAGVTITAASGYGWTQTGPLPMFSISVEYGDDQTESYLVWCHGDNS